MRLTTQKIIILLVGIICFTPSLMAQKSKEAKKILDATTSQFEKAGGTEAQFVIETFNSKGELTGDMPGTIKLKGNQFQVETPDITTWFNGDTQWSYINSADEVNITHPTPEELQAINPYSFLSLYKKGFDYSLKETTLRGKEVYEIRVKAENKKQEIQEIVLSIEKGNYAPLCIRLRKDKEWTRIVIRDYKTNINWPESTFRFNRDNYPNVEIIDLR